MRGQIIIVVLILVCLIAIGILKQAGESRISQLRFIRLDTASPKESTANDPGDLQRLIDDVAKFANEGKWGSASRTAKTLEETWVLFRPQSNKNTLGIVEEIDSLISILYQNIWEQDVDEVMSTSQKLTQKFHEITKGLSSR